MRIIIGAGQNVPGNRKSLWWRPKSQGDLTETYERYILGNRIAIRRGWGQSGRDTNALCDSLCDLALATSPRWLSIFADALRAHNIGFALETIPGLTVWLRAPDWTRVDLSGSIERNNREALKGHASTDWTRCRMHRRHREEVSNAALSRGCLFQRESRSGINCICRGNHHVFVVTRPSKANFGEKFQIIVNFNLLSYDFSRSLRFEVDLRDGKNDLMISTYCKSF